MEIDELLNVHFGSSNCIRLLNAHAGVQAIEQHNYPIATLSESTPNSDAAVQDEFEDFQLRQNQIKAKFIATQSEITKRLGDLIETVAMLEEHMNLARTQEQMEREMLIKAEQEFRENLAISEALYSRKTAHLSGLPALEVQRQYPQLAQSASAPPRPLLDDCPVCLDPLERNVYSCEKCHRLLCQECSKKMNKCPICRADFRPGVNPRRNEAIELLLQRQ